MGQAWIRQEVKRDRFAEAVDQTVSAARKHPQRAVGAAVGALAALLAVVYFVARFFEVRTQAWEELAAAESQLKTGSGAAAGLEKLDGVRAEFPNAPASDYASLLKGDVLFYGGQFDRSADAYAEALDKARPEARPFLLCGQGLALEAAGKPSDAAVKLKAFLDQYPDHYLAPEAHFALARAQDLLQQKDAAKAAYEKVAILYPDTDWAKEAQERSKALSAPAKR